MADYTQNHPIKGETLATLYRSVGWEGYAADPNGLAQALSRSTFSAAAWENGALIGLVRVVGDGAFIAYIQDILVHPAHQRRGIGSRLIKMALENCTVRQIVLMTDDIPHTCAFYEKNGFSKPEASGLVSYIRLKRDAETPI